MRPALLLLLLLQSELDALKRTLLDAKAERKVREEAAVKLALDKDGGGFLLGLSGQGKLPPEVKDTVAGSIFRNPDLGVRALASQFFRRPAKGGEPFPSVDKLLELKGDSANGRKVYFGAASGCSKCHLWEGEGGDVGPNLTEIRHKYMRKELLDTILNPSAEILFGFDAWLFQTKDGQVVSGILLQEGDEYVVKEAGGEPRALAAGAIAFKKKLTASLMPDNVALGLTPQELADLLAFLRAEPPPK